jgi:chromosomal replication initiation ATPase DnaA
MANQDREDLVARLLAGPVPDLDCILDGFVAGPVSGVAVAAVRLVAAVADRPAPYSPVFIHGPRDCGKSSLLHALANDLREQGVSLVHLDGAAVKKASRMAPPDFGQRIRLAFRKARVVIIDDLHMLARASCADDVFAAVAEIVGRRHHVVLTSSLPLSRLATFRSYVRGLRNGLELLMEPSTSEELATAGAAGPSDTAVLRGISRFYGMPVPVLTGKRRTADALHARHVGMYVMYSDKRQHLSLPAIGKIFGDRDHTTVLHGVRKIERLVKKDRRLAAEIDELRQAIGIEAAE